MRSHINLRKDEEANLAAWEAARGAVVGAAKVNSFRQILLFGTSIEARTAPSIHSIARQCYSILC
jgi:hypothetical protein